MIVVESRSGGGLKRGLRKLGHFDSRSCTTGIISSVTPLMTTTTCTTAWWEMGVFSFVLAVTEVNAFLAYQFFCHPDPVPTLQQFCHKLAWELIKNKWLAREDLEKSHVVNAVHQLMVALNNVMKYVNGRWRCKAKQPHQNYLCLFKQCGKPPKRINTYCSCCPTKWICKFCHAVHVISELKQE